MAVAARASRMASLPSQYRPPTLAAPSNAVSNGPDRPLAAKDVPRARERSAAARAADRRRGQADDSSRREMRATISSAYNLAPAVADPAASAHSSFHTSAAAVSASCWPTYANGRNCGKWSLKASATSDEISSRQARPTSARVAGSSPPWLSYIDCNRVTSSSRPDSPPSDATLAAAEAIAPRIRADRSDSTAPRSAASRRPAWRRRPGAAAREPAKVEANRAAPARVGRPTPVRMREARRGPTASAACSSARRRQRSMVSDKGPAREELRRARSIRSSDTLYLSALSCRYEFICGSSDERASRSAMLRSGMYGRSAGPARRASLTSCSTEAARASAAGWARPSFSRKGSTLPNAASAAFSPDGPLPRCAGSQRRAARAVARRCSTSPALRTVSLTSSSALRDARRMLASRSSKDATRAAILSTLLAAPEPPLPPPEPPPV
mmetsp:Transcript_21828/g.59797  ORF Transcript_21828/g.59797 Transcript_21828/m.59797 type:complete len:441 (-) Transcript_21828:947-2269(-)